MENLVQETNQKNYSYSDIQVKFLQELVRLFEVLKTILYGCLVLGEAPNLDMVRCKITASSSGTVWG